MLLREIEKCIIQVDEHYTKRHLNNEILAIMKFHTSSLQTMASSQH